MKLDVKKLISKLLSAIIGTNDRIKYELISNTTYSSSTAWAKRATFTAPVDGLYRITTNYNNSAVAGQGVSATSATSIVQAKIIENTQGASVDHIWFLNAGSYAVWTRCGSNGANNSVVVYRVLHSIV